MIHSPPKIRLGLTLGPGFQIRNLVALIRTTYLGTIVLAFNHDIMTCTICGTNMKIICLPNYKLTPKSICIPLASYVMLYLLFFLCPIHLTSFLHPTQVDSFALLGFVLKHVNRLLN